MLLYSDQRTLITTNHDRRAAIQIIGKSCNTNHNKIEASHSPEGAR